MNRYFLTSGVQSAPWLDFWGHVRNRLPIDPQNVNTKPPPDFLTLQGLTGLFFLTFLTE